MANFVPFLISNWDAPDDPEKLAKKAKNTASLLASTVLNHKELGANPEVSAHELCMMAAFIGELGDRLEDEILLNEELALENQNIQIQLDVKLEELADVRKQR